MQITINATQEEYKRIADITDILFDIDIIDVIHVRIADANNLQKNPCHEKLQMTAKHHENIEFCNCVKSSRPHLQRSVGRASQNS